MNLKKKRISKWLILVTLMSLILNLFCGQTFASNTDADNSGNVTSTQTANYENSVASTVYSGYDNNLVDNKSQKKSEPRVLNKTRPSTLTDDDISVIQGEPDNEIIVKYKNNVIIDKNTHRENFKSKQNIKKLVRRRGISAIDAEVWQFDKNDDRDDIIKALYEDQNIEYVDKNYVPKLASTSDVYYRYIDNATGTMIQADRYCGTYTAGTTVTIYSPSLDGYTPVYTSQSFTVPSSSPCAVIVKYNRIRTDVYIRSLDNATGEYIKADQYYTTCDFGTTLPISSPDISGYNPVYATQNFTPNTSHSYAAIVKYNKGEVSVGEKRILESNYPYSNNSNLTWTVSENMAYKIRVHFEYIDVENGYDYVKTSAGDSWTGRYSGWSNWVNGSSINITLTSDSSITYTGFKIDYLDYKLSGLNASSPNDTYFSNQPYLKKPSGSTGYDINVAPAWANEYNDEGVTVAVIDTGVDITHPDLESNIWNNPGEVPNGSNDDTYGYPDDTHGWNFANQSNDVTDSDGHGTKVAGTIAAVGNNSQGVIGVAHRSKVLPLKYSDIPSVVDCIKYAQNKGAKVVNTSIGFTNNSSNSLKQIMTQCTDMLFVVAAGNEGMDFSGSTSPILQNFKLTNEIVVTSMDESPNHGWILNSGNYGANVDIGAPGANIYTLTIGGGTSWFSATSAATPLVSGVAALIFQKNPTYTGAQAKSKIVSTYKYIASMKNRHGDNGQLVPVSIINCGIPDATAATN